MFLLLRPKKKVSASLSAFRHAGLVSYAVGLIDTRETSDAAAELEHLFAKKPTLVIVTSTVAAYITNQYLNKVKAVSTDISYIAIGSSSAKEMSCISTRVTTPHIQTSEGLLSLPCLQGIKGRAVGLIKGKSGRDLIEKKLLVQGAVLSIADVYERVTLTPPYVPEAVPTNHIRWVVATSGSLIKAAFDYFDPSWLQQLTWITVSGRLVEELKQRGIKKVQLCAGASDQALIHCAKNIME